MGGFTQLSNGFLLFSEKFADGGQYEGSWQAGRYSGFGTCTWEGMFVCVCVLWLVACFLFVLKCAGSPNHKLLCVCVLCVRVDGRRYRGEWRNGMAHGRGTETYPNGAIRHEGQWVDDEPVR